MALDLGNAPEWAAVGVAVAAALYAGWSRKEARRSANAAEETLRQQQTPEFTAEVENPNGNDEGRHGWHRLMVRVAKSPAGPIDGLRVDLLTDGVRFTPGQNGVAAAATAGDDNRRTAVHAQQRTDPVSIDAGERAYWRVEFDEHEDGLPQIEQVEIRVTATRNGKPWVTVMHAPIKARRTHQQHQEDLRQLYRLGKKDRQGGSARPPLS